MKTIIADIHHGNYRVTIKSTSLNILEALKQLATMNNYCASTEHQIGKVKEQLDADGKGALGWVAYRLG